MDEHQPNQGEDTRLGTDDASESEQTRGADRGLEYRQRRAEMLKGSREQREFQVTDMECRTLDDGTMRWTGLASATETFYDIGDPERGGFRERIARNAFRRTISEDPDVVLLGNHEGWPLARTRNGSLTLRETPAGLQWAADLDPEDPDTQMLGRKIERGLVNECSFAFRCTDDAWNDDFTERTVKSVSLHRGDVSVVTHGANPETAVTLQRSAEILVEMEARSGKTLSAKTRGEIEAIKAAAENLLAESDMPEPEAESEQEQNAAPPPEDASERAAEPVETVEPATPAVPVVIPDHTTRAIERVAALRRVA